LLINYSGRAPERARTITPRRARSRRDFVNKLGMVVEESDESVFWLTLVGRSGLNETGDQKDLLAEGRELLAIFVKSAKTASTNNRQ